MHCHMPDLSFCNAESLKYSSMGCKLGSLEFWTLEITAGNILVITLQLYEPGTCKLMNLQQEFCHKCGMKIHSDTKKSKVLLI
jgi:hypothetical protein